jgi:hypothetical protein
MAVVIIPATSNQHQGAPRSCLTFDEKYFAPGFDGANISNV